MRIIMKNQIFKRSFDDGLWTRWTSVKRDFIFQQNKSATFASLSIWCHFCHFLIFSAGTFSDPEADYGDARVSYTSESTVTRVFGSLVNFDVWLLFFLLNKVQKMYVETTSRLMRSTTGTKSSNLSFPDVEAGGVGIVLLIQNESLTVDSLILLISSFASSSVNLQRSILTISFGLWTG